MITRLKISIKHFRRLMSKVLVLTMKEERDAYLGRQWNEKREKST